MSDRVQYDVCFYKKSVCSYKRTSKQCFLLTGITSVFATTAYGFTFLLSQVFQRVKRRFCHLYSAVILRQELLCSRSLLCNRAVWSGAALSGLAMSGLAISAPPYMTSTTTNKDSWNNVWIVVTYSLRYCVVLMRLIYRLSNNVKKI